VPSGGRRRPDHPRAGYHFALAPQLIRRKLPKATIITFWHIPWPNFEQLAICPWTDDFEGLLGNGILGSDAVHCNNFDAVDRYLGSRSIASSRRSCIADRARSFGRIRFRSSGRIAQP
jgi:trehalose-6-phosphate synthase